MEINTLLIVVVGIFVLYLAINGKLRNVPAAYHTLMGDKA